MFVSKMFKITKVEGHIFCGFGRRNKQKMVFSRSSHPEVFCQKSVLKYLVKLTGRHLCRGLSLACRRETLLKKRLLHRCFPIKFIRASQSMNSLTTSTMKFNFVENIWNFGPWSNLKTYLEHIAWESFFPKIFFL